MKGRKEREIVFEPFARKKRKSALWSLEKEQYGKI